MAFSINSLTLTGTHTITNGSTSVTGVGSAYNTQLLVGSPIVISGQTRFVATIVSATSITVTQAFTVSATSVAGTYNTTVTQSFTDASLAALSSIPAIITTARVGGFTTYDFGVLRLIVTGNLSIGAEVAPFEQIIIGQDAGPSTAPDIDVLNGGVLTLGHQYTSDGVIDSVTSQILIFEPGANKGFDESNGFTTATAFLRVNSGGTFNWMSGVINVWGGIVTNAGSTLNIGFTGMTRKPVLDYMRVSRTVDGAQQWYSQGTTNIFGMILLGGRKNAAPRSGAGFAQLSLPTVLTGIEFKYVFAAFLASSLMNPGTYVFSNIGDTRGRPLFSVGGTGSDRIVEFLNYEKGSDFLIAATTSGRSNTVRATKNYIVQTKGVSSSNISSVVYVIGKSGTQKTLSSTNGSTTTDKFLLRETIYQGATTPSSDVYFSKNNNNTDLIDIYSFNYLYEIVYQPNFELKGNLTKTTSLDHKLDANVTLSEAAAVAKLASSFSVNTVTNTITVTANSTLDDLYDVMKAWKTRNVQSQLEYPTIGTQPVTANGDTLVTAMGIVGLEFLTAGPKFKKIQANATANGAFSNIAIIGNVIQDIPTDLSGVSISGTLTYNTNTNLSNTITNTGINTVVNIGTGIVTINRVNSTIVNYTDAEINFIDSTISVIGADTVSFHPTANDRDLNLNASGTFTGSTAFKFGSTINGSLMSGTLYLRCVAGGIPFDINKVIVLGDNLVDLGTTAQLASLSAKIDLTAKEASLNIVNQGLQKASQFKSHKTNI
jgi:hypothetical protein